MVNMLMDQVIIVIPFIWHLFSKIPWPESIANLPMTLLPLFDYFFIVQMRFSKSV